MLHVEVFTACNNMLQNNDGYTKYKLHGTQYVFVIKLLTLN